MVDQFASKIIIRARSCWYGFRGVADAPSCVQYDDITCKNI